MDGQTSAWHDVVVACCGMLWHVVACRGMSWHVAIRYVRYAILWYRTIPTILEGMAAYIIR